MVNPNFVDKLAGFKLVVINVNFILNDLTFSEICLLVDLVVSINSNHKLSTLLSCLLVIFAPGLLLRFAIDLIHASTYLNCKSSLNRRKLIAEENDV